MSQGIQKSPAESLHDLDSRLTETIQIETLSFCLDDLCVGEILSNQISVCECAGTLVRDSKT